ncbi:hypothetical protein BH10BAC3_BH10BAC3_28660 [soil metagenome]
MQAGKTYIGFMSSKYRFVDGDRILFPSVSPPRDTDVFNVTSVSPLGDTEGKQAKSPAL